MVHHVTDRGQESGALSVTVATDDVRIEQQVRDFGGAVVMTSGHHESGTDRLQQAAELLQLEPEDIVVNVQGDEPLIAPSVIQQVAKNLAEHPECSVATLCEPLSSWEDVQNPNFVKVVRDQEGRGLYFSRSPVPFHRDVDHSTSRPANSFRHLGIYAYRVSALNEFITWPLGQLEGLEKLEQLRFLENGHRIHVDVALEGGAPGVDTPDDVAKVEHLLAKKGLL